MHIASGGHITNTIVALSNVTASSNMAYGTKVVPGASIANVRRRATGRGGMLTDTVTDSRRATGLCVCERQCMAVVGFLLVSTEMMA
jgi:hypothetical protein